MLRLRYWSRLFTAFIARFKGLLAIGALLGIAFFVFLTVIIPLFFQASVQRIGVTGRYHIDELPQEILLDIGEGLTGVTEEGEVTEGLAERWEATDEGKTWTFHLKKGLVWHDNTPVTAQNVQYSFEDVTIERPDDYTIIFKVKSPFAPFPTVVSRPTFKRGLLGTGQWKVKKVDLAGSFVERLILVNSQGKRKDYRFYPTQEQTKLAYKLGKVDQLTDLIDPAPFQKWSTAQVNEEVRKNRYVGIFFNNADDLFSDNKELRQALSYATNKSDFEQDRAISPISPESWGFNSQIKRYDYDKVHAQELLSKLPKEMISQMDIRLVTTPALLSVAERIEKDWEEVGVKTTVQVSSVVPQEFQAFLAIYDIPKDPDQYAIWHSTQAETNISKYHNVRIDKLLEDGRLELDPEDRKRIYFDFQRFLLEDAPAIFLYHPKSYTVTRK